MIILEAGRSEIACIPRRVVLDRVLWGFETPGRGFCVRDTEVLVGQKVGSCRYLARFAYDKAVTKGDYRA